ncbi:MAG: hypothetical protein IJ125_09120 [Atopobiaceae bacterium]|nr:hypothetical protein [Atopobiaceae bacterium]
MVESETVAVKGAKALQALAQRFPQLYVAPAEGAQDAHRLASGRGVAPEQATLDHFVGSPDDELRSVETPPGPIDVLFLKHRADFETFLQIIGHKAAPVPIAPTVGAITYRGLADWSKVAASHKSYVESGGADWASEFSRLAQTGAFRSEIVVISEGPYSNVAADETSYTEDQWIHISREIRLHHECAHVVCRRELPDDILPIWDEITADVVGLLCATADYDIHLATRFLGVSDPGYVGGRLAEYLDEEQTTRIDEISREVYAACMQVDELCGDAEKSQPFEFLLDLKRKPIIRY